MEGRHNIDIADTEDAEHQEEHSIKRSCLSKWVYGNLPVVIAFGSLSAGSIIQQIIIAKSSSKASTLSSIRAMISGGTIPTGIGIFNIMLSDVFKGRHEANFDPSKIGPIYQVNLLYSLAFSLFTYGLLTSARPILQSPLFETNSLSQDDISSIESCLHYDYVNIPLNAIYTADLILFFQNRNLASAALSIFCVEALEVLVTYGAFHLTNGGLNAIAIASFESIFFGLLINKLIQTGCIPSCLKSYFPSMEEFKLFEVSANSREHWGDISKKILKYGTLPWLSTLTNNAIGTFITLKFSSVGFQKAIGVLQTACNNFTALMLITLSPVIAESTGIIKRHAILKQSLLASIPLLPCMAVMAAGFIFPDKMASTISGNKNLTADLVKENVALIMGQTMLSSLTGILYSTLIDCFDTNWPSLIVIFISLLKLGLCNVYEESKDPISVGNYANITAMGIGLALMTSYVVCKNTPYCKPKTNAAYAFSLNSLKQPLNPDNQNQLELADIP